jgi:uncharacterized phage-associated protein
MGWPFSKSRRRPAHVLAAANAMLEIVAETGGEANLIRLQRMLVLAQCRSLELSDRPLFEAHVVILGDTPGMTQIHHAFRPFGTMPITAPAQHPDLPFPHPADADRERLAIMREIVHGCRNVSGYGLGIALRRIAPGARNGDRIPPETLGRPLEELVA